MKLGCRINKNFAENQISDCLSIKASSQLKSNFYDIKILTTKGFLRYMKVWNML
jgi:hypothetical protein